MITPAFSLTSTERVLPRMALDFTTAALDPRVTVTRAANTATRINSAGLIEIVNANLPRFDYDPTTLVCKGLLIEESRANLALYSQQLAANHALTVSSVTGTFQVGEACSATGGGTGTYLTNIGATTILLTTSTGTFTGTLTGAQSGATATISAAAQVWRRDFSGVGTAPVVTPNYALAPDGTMTATRVQCALNGGTTTSDYSWLVQTLTGTSCRGSLYIKTNDNTSKTVILRAQSSLSTTVTGSWSRYDWSAGTLTAALFGVGLRGGQTPTNSDTVDLLVWGAQLEAGAFPTSYIPTTTTSLTRNADVVTMTGTNFSDWFNSAQGTFVAKAQSNDPAGGNNRVFWCRNTATGTYVDALYADIRRGAGTWQAGVRSGNVIQWTANLSSTSSPSVAAVAYKASNFAAAINGGSPSTSASGSIPTLDAMNIGSHIDGTYLNGLIQRLYYYSQRLTNAETSAFSKG